MVENLVIVESPTKAKMLQKFLGKKFSVESSFGHIRDLPGKKSEVPKNMQEKKFAALGIDIENNFEPIYVIPTKAKKYASKIKNLVDTKTKIWLASDEDREGEAIAWHLLEIIKPKKTNQIFRIVFHEITKDAILKAVENPRDLDKNLVNAQQARRVLDRLVGYTLSPLLWKKIRFGLSAGRVQSVAVKILVDREREIKKFIPEESWSVLADFEKDKKKFIAEFKKLDGKKFIPKNENEAEAIVSAISGQDFEIQNIDEKEVSRNPAPPFTTSTLQQEASRKLGFSVKKTMMLAQKLYEGIEMSGEAGGLITYMRTDSVNLSEKAIKDSKAVISKKFGKEFSFSRKWKTKSKGAQEAHEAIRPTNIGNSPEKLNKFLTPDAFKIYDLIWKRTLASQMSPAKLQQTGIDLEVFSKSGAKKSHLFRATGQKIIFPGFLKIYSESSDDDINENEENFLPSLKKGEKLKPKKIEKKQHFSKPPPRFTEASLVKKLESEGIGRPSTYAPTITTIISRGYVDKNGKQLVPTDTAFIVTELLENHFKNIVDLEFTAKMENDLDKISIAELNWVKFLKNFWQPFKDLVDEKSKSLKKSEITAEETNEVCEKCGKKMVIKLSRFGKFLSCSAYPDCKNARPLKDDPQKKSEIENLEKEFSKEVCEKCGKKMIVKSGRFGFFLACSAYPDCKNTKPIVRSIGKKCPDCGGEVVEKFSKKGKKFFGCSKYPDCKFATWNDPRKGK